MMKKNYIAPKGKVILLQPFQQLLNISAGDRGIGYGGVDTGGTKDPSARALNYYKDEEDEEDTE